MFLTIFISLLISCAHGRWVIQDSEGNNQLEVQVQMVGNKIFDDSGSGADQNLSCWEPRDVGNGFWRVGHCCQRNKGGNGMDCRAPLVKDISGKDITDITRPLATPNAVTGPIWTDRGSGANTDFGFWTLVCPDGFVALSDLGAVGYQVPIPLAGSLRCVNPLYARRCSLGDRIWYDRGSGANADGSVWEQINGENQSEFEQHFRANRAHSAPTTQPWCLRGMVWVDDE